MIKEYNSHTRETKTVSPEQYLERIRGELEVVSWMSDSELLRILKENRVHLDSGYSYAFMPYDSEDRTSDVLGVLGSVWTIILIIAGFFIGLFASAFIGVN